MSACLAYLNWASRSAVPGSLHVRSELTRQILLFAVNQLSTFTNCLPFSHLCRVVQDRLSSSCTPTSLPLPRRPRYFVRLFVPLPAYLQRTAKPKTCSYEHISAPQNTNRANQLDMPVCKNTFYWIRNAGPRLTEALDEERAHVKQTSRGLGMRRGAANLLYKEYG